MPAPKTIVPPEYAIDLDRLPAQPAGCSGSLVMVLGVIVAMIAGGGLMLTRQAAPTPPPIPTITRDETTPTPTESPTLDSWDMTGTALAVAGASPTIDYCFWLTPTDTPPPTVESVDAWSATGTAVYEATHPYQSPTPTPDVPQAWCNNIPSPTPTLTALKIGTQATDTPAPTATPMPTLTETRQPAATVGGGGGYIPPAPPAPPGYEVLPTLDLIVLPPSVPMTPTLTVTPASGLTTRYG